MRQLNSKWLVALFFVGVLTVAIAGGQRAEALDYSQVPGGQAGLPSQLDRNCRINWNNTAGTADVRTRVNQASYQYYSWISSGASTGNTNIEVTAGSTTPVELRLVSMLQVCWFMANPGVNDMASLNSRMASFGDNGVDTSIPCPGPQLAGVCNPAYANRPSFTKDGFRVYSVSASSGTVVLTGDANVFSDRPSNNSSRMWIKSTTLRWTPPPGGLTGDTTVSITANVARMTQAYFNDASSTFWEVACKDGPYAWHKSGGYFNANIFDAGSGSIGLPQNSWADKCYRVNIPLDFTVKVPYNYTLHPKAYLGGSDQALPGDTVSFKYDVLNDGPTKSRGTWWTARLFVVPASVSYSPSSMGEKIIGGVGANGNNVPAGVTRNDGMTPNSGANQDGGWIFNLNPPNNNGNSMTLTSSGQTYADRIQNGVINVRLANFSLDVGDRVCSVLEVAPSDHTANGRTAQSAPVCITITKSPQLNLRGTDSYSGARYWGDNSAQINKEGGFKSSKFADT
ncbi:hypothetical protein FWG95_04765, partial [Candidatus Saccharibacteria bacterium]|nr:hypothetical protein [Candidatus Saccharibacteria bacterium]